MVYLSNEPLHLDWHRICIYDLGGWQAADLDFLPPGQARRKFKGTGELPTELVGILRRGTRTGLVRFAAKHGLRGLTVPRMKDLMVELGHGAARSTVTTELQTFTFLVKTIFDGITDAEIDALWEIRTGKKRVPYRSEIDKETLAVLKEELDEQDVADAEKDLALHARLAKPLVPLAKPKAAPKPAAAAKKAAAKPKGKAKAVPACQA